MKRKKITSESVFLLVADRWPKKRISKTTIFCNFVWWNCVCWLNENKWWQVKYVKSCSQTTRSVILAMVGKIDIGRKLSRSVDLGDFWIGWINVSFHELGTVWRVRLELTIWVITGQMESINYLIKRIHSPSDPHDVLLAIRPMTRRRCAGVTGATWERPVATRGSRTASSGPVIIMNIHMCLYQPCGRCHQAFYRLPGCFVRHSIDCLAFQAVYRLPRQSINCLGNL